ncbi:hypothetical protein BH20CHL3_BH20CHL3_01840 [soil metagenome]
MDGERTPWNDKPESERHERILLEVGSGRQFDGCVAVITDADWEFWQKMEKNVRKIGDRGGTVEIPFG